MVEEDADGPAPGRRRIPLHVGGTRVGTLDVDELTLADPMVPSVTSFVAVALANQQLAQQVEAQLAEVEDSRRRLVHAADIERRRIERDLHDGVQQLLLSVGMQLSLALVAAQREGATLTSERLQEAQMQLRTATGELRRLVHGLVPAALADLGLVAAVNQLAERSPIPVRLSIDLGRRLPSVVEATAYYVVSEALTNTARHAGATEVHIRVRDLGTRLEIDVGDNGIGGARADTGSGLVGLRDRVAAIGGSFDVISPEHDGTCLRLELPTGAS